jgi:hypothetical protein
VDVKQPCTGKTLRVTVKDHGPTIHCRGPYGCNLETTVKFDLTPCAFHDLGGSLSQGIMDLKATDPFSC